jgi:hypothetical protein
MMYVGFKSNASHIEIDRLSEELEVRSLPVGLRTNDGLNIFVADDGAFGEYVPLEAALAGSPDQTGRLLDLLIAGAAVTG